MSDPQLVNGPVWIHECTHMTISPEDLCQQCAAIAQAVKEERERIRAYVEGLYIGESPDPQAITLKNVILQMLEAARD